MTLPDGTTATLDKIGSHTFLDGLRNCIQNGCVGNGITDDSAALNTLANTTLQSGGGIIYFPAPYTFRISNNLTFPSNVTLMVAEGATISIDTGKTVTVNGAIIADDIDFFTGLGDFEYGPLSSRTLMTTPTWPYVDVAETPSYGSLWKFSDATLVSIVVAANVATVTTSTPHGLIGGGGSVITLSGCYTDDELNGTAIVASAPTTTTFTIPTSGVANGSYTDTSIAIQDLSGGLFGGDNSNVLWERFRILDTCDRKQLYDQYFAYQFYPRMLDYDVSSGYSGTTAIINGAAGVSQVNKKLVPVNNTTGFSVGLVILLTNTAGLIETRKIASIVGGVSITMSTDLENDYVLGNVIGVASRTNSSAYFTNMTMRNGAGGDMYGHTFRIELANAPQWGQNHPYYNGTGGAIGGDITASANQVYGQASEFTFTDAGFDVTMIGDVRSFNRTVDTAANRQTWIGSFKQSYGTKYADACYVAAGAWKVPFDAVPAGDSTNWIAFQMRHTQRFYLNSSKTNYASGVQGLWGDIVGDAYFTYNNSTGAIEFFTANTKRVRVSDVGLIASSRIQGIQVAQASANSLTLGSGNSFYLNTTTQLNLISITDWQDGAVIRLIFSGNTTVKNNQAAVGAFKPILLAGGIDFSATNADVLTLICVNQSSWLEVSRSVN